MKPTIPEDGAGENTYRPERVEGHADRFIVLSGCSGGGKSSLLAELARRGFRTFEEPGRQVVKEQLYIGGDALPWDNVAAFVELTVSRSIFNLITAARGDGLSFFDRSIVDQIGGLQHLGLPVPRHVAAAAERLRYRHEIFVVPPWPEIFLNDKERRHGFEESVASYKALLGTFAQLGYRTVEVPKLGVAARADFVLDHLEAGRAALIA